MQANCFIIHIVVKWFFTKTRSMDATLKTKIKPLSVQWVWDLGQGFQLELLKTSLKTHPKLPTTNKQFYFF